MMTLFQLGDYCYNTIEYIYRNIEYMAQDEEVKPKLDPKRIRQIRNWTTTL